MKVLDPSRSALADYALLVWPDWALGLLRNSLIAATKDWLGVMLPSFAMRCKVPNALARNTVGSHTG